MIYNYHITSSLPMIFDIDVYKRQVVHSNVVCIGKSKKHVGLQIVQQCANTYKMCILIIVNAM